MVIVMELLPLKLGTQAKENLVYGVWLLEACRKVTRTERDRENSNQMDLNMF